VSLIKEKYETRKLPMMPIRDVVIFPYMMTPFVVGRESSVRALDEALGGDKRIFLATQHDPSVDEPKPERDLPGRMHCQYRAEPEDAGWQHQGSGGGH
jgi:ATP-dependent Lon protease